MWFRVFFQPSVENLCQDQPSTAPMKKMSKKSRDPDAENDQNKKRIATAATF